MRAWATDFFNRNRGLTIVVGLLVFLLLVSGLWFWLSGSGSQQQGSATGAASTSSASASAAAGAEVTVFTDPADDKPQERMLPAGGGCPPRVSVTHGKLTGFTDLTWHRVGQGYVPHSAKHGPLVVEPNGVRKCYAQTPEGAALALYDAAELNFLLEDFDAYYEFGRYFYPGLMHDTGTEWLNFISMRNKVRENGVPPFFGVKVPYWSPQRATVWAGFSQGEQAQAFKGDLFWNGTDWEIEPSKGRVRNSFVSNIEDFTFIRRR